MDDNRKQILDTPFLCTSQRGVGETRRVASLGPAASSNVNNQMVAIKTDPMELCYSLHAQFNFSGKTDKNNRYLAWKTCMHSCSHREQNTYSWKTKRVFSGPGSSVGIVTGYGLDGPGIESGWTRDFPHLSIPALGPTQTPVQRKSALFPGGKAAGEGG